MGGVSLARWTTGRSGSGIGAGESKTVDGCARGLSGPGERLATSGLTWSAAGVGGAVTAGDALRGGIVVAGDGARGGTAVGGGVEDGGLSGTVPVDLLSGGEALGSELGVELGGSPSLTWALAGNGSASATTRSAKMMRCQGGNPPRGGERFMPVSVSLALYRPGG